jgi:hypothetical protein
MKYFFLACTLIFGVNYAWSQPAVSGEAFLDALLETSPLFDTTSLHSATTTPFDEKAAWKSWRTVENFTYGKDRGILPMVADLNSLHPYFRDRIINLINSCKAQGIELAIVESYRTRAKQAEYFGMGRKYTRSRGGKSKHQYGLAVDVVPIVDSIPVWDDVHLWRKIGIAGEKLGLRWGGRWRAPYDPAHFEWAGGVSTSQLAWGVLPVIPKGYSHTYPCIEEDVKRLQKYWEAWEVEQSVSARTSSGSYDPSATVSRP